MPVAVEALSAEEELRVRTTEGAHFHIVGVDARSVVYVEALTDHIATVAEAYLKHAPIDFKPKVFVALRPSGHVDFEGDYRLTQDVAKINLDFKWSEALRLQTVCYALTEAYLKQYAIDEYGADAPGKIRSWVVAALANKAYMELRPSVYIGMVEAARLEEVPDCASLVADYLKAGAVNQRQTGYWVLEVMRSAGFSRAEVAHYCERALAGENIGTALLAASTERLEGSGSALQDWWDFQFRERLGFGAA